MASYTSAIGMRIIRPKHVLSVKKVSGKILSTMEAEGREAVLLLNKTIENWNAPPTMTYVIRFEGGDIRLWAGPQGTGHNAWKWFWLNKGTRVRYADLSDDWRSKTTVGRLSSGAGAGQVLARGRDARRHKGITARGWDIIILRMMKRRFKMNIDRAIKEGLR